MSLRKPKWLWSAGIAIATVAVVGSFALVRNLDRLRTAQPYLEFRIDGMGGVNELGLLEHKNLLVSATDDAAIRFWDRDSGAVVATLTAKFGPADLLAVDPKEKWIVVNYQPAYRHKPAVAIWDVETQTMTGQLEMPNADISCLAANPDGDTLAVGSLDGSGRLWSVSKQKEIRLLEGRQWRSKALDFNPDGSMLVSGGNTIELWETRTGAKLRSIEVPDHIRSVLFLPESTRFAAGGNGSVRMFDATSGKLESSWNTPDVYRSAITKLRLSPDGNLLASGDQLSNLDIWDLRNGVLARSFTGCHATSISGLQFNRSGDAIFTASNLDPQESLPGGELRLWRIK